MILLRLLTILMVLCFVTGLVSQVLIPLWRGTVLFPFFRSKDEAALADSIARAQQIKVEEAQAAELETMLDRSKSTNRRRK